MRKLFLEMLHLHWTEHRWIFIRQIRQGICRKREEGVFQFSKCVINCAQLRRISGWLCVTWWRVIVTAWLLSLNLSAWEPLDTSVTCVLTSTHPWQQSSAMVTWDTLDNQGPWSCFCRKINYHDQQLHFSVGDSNWISELSTGHVVPVLGKNWKIEVTCFLCSLDLAPEKIFWPSHENGKFHSKLGLTKFAGFKHNKGQKTASGRIIRRKSPPKSWLVLQRQDKIPHVRAQWQTLKGRGGKAQLMTKSFAIWRNKIAWRENIFWRLGVRCHICILCPVSVRHLDVPRPESAEVSLLIYSLKNCLLLPAFEKICSSDWERTLGKGGRGRPPANVFRWTAASKTEIWFDFFFFLFISLQTSSLLWAETGALVAQIETWCVFSNPCPPVATAPSPTCSGNFKGPAHLYRITVSQVPGHWLDSLFAWGW